MGTLSALLLVTPVFGLALSPPPSTLAPGNVNAAIHATLAPGAASLHHALPPLQAAATDEAAEPSDEGDEADEADGDDGGEIGMGEYAALMRRRAEIMSIHKPLGIATWAAMGITLGLGFIQNANLYGPFASLENTPCVTGDGIIFGESQCGGVPWLHLTSAMVTTGLYAATFALSLLMPDPDNLDEGDSAYASNLRLHKVLRWVHFVGMIAQLALGIVIANGDAFGLDRANDYDALQALTLTHMGIGLVTFGAMTWAGAMFVL
jgi:hypothetical protein